MGVILQTHTLPMPLFHHWIVVTGQVATTCGLHHVPQPGGGSAAPSSPDGEASPPHTHTHTHPGHHRGCRRVPQAYGGANGCCGASVWASRESVEGCLPLGGPALPALRHTGQQQAHHHLQCVVVLLMAPKGARGAGGGGRCCLARLPSCSCSRPTAAAPCWR